MYQVCLFFSRHKQWNIIIENILVLEIFLVCVISARDESVDVVVLRFLQSFCNIIIRLDNRGSIAVILLISLKIKT